MSEYLLSGQQSIPAYSNDLPLKSTCTPKAAAISAAVAAFALCCVLGATFSSPETSFRAAGPSTSLIKPAIQPSTAASAFPSQGHLSKGVRAMVSRPSAMKYPETSQATANMAAGKPDFSQVAGGGILFSLWSAAAVIAYAVFHKLQPSKPPMVSSMAMIAVTGKPFDPLGLREKECAPSPSPLNSLQLAHGRMVLCGLLGGVVALKVLSHTNPALAEVLPELDDFNYDFEVEFEGQEVSHRYIAEIAVVGQFIGFIGALVGGASARERKQQVEELADKLKAVNRQLRQQARRSQEGIYTPTKALEVDDCEEECDIERASVLETLRFGRNKLREGQAQAALLQFEKALEILRSSKNFERPLEAERKAYRGIGSAQVQLQQFEPALGAMQRVLELTSKIGDRVGLCDAYGVIADIYTEMNDLTKAGEYYDLYIENLTCDTSSDTM